MNLTRNIFFLVPVLLLILFAGCTAPGQQPAPPVTTGQAPESTPYPTVTESPATQVPATTLTPAPFTKDDVNKLFIDIAFGCDSTWITKVAPSSENHLFFSLEGQSAAGDTDFIRQFTRRYNLISAEGIFSDDPLSSRGSPIIFYPVESMKSLDRTYIACQEVDPVTGETLYMVYKPVTDLPGGGQVVTTRVYINSNLPDDQHRHYLERAMLYYLGYPGQTYAYPDSVFYYNTRTNVDLTPLDIEALRTMYNPGIYQGMSVQEARYLLLNE